VRSTCQSPMASISVPMAARLNTETTRPAPSFRPSYPLDHLVGARDHGVRHRKAERLGGLELITSSYLVGACTGRSAGFSPLRMRST
jgi:hypothetical protein